MNLPFPFAVQVRDAVRQYMPAVLVGVAVTILSAFALDMWEARATGLQMGGTLTDDGSAPVRVRIPAIGVDAPVAPVGVRPDGLMDIPSSPDELGWFAPGFIPGAAGNAVIAGHVDTAAGTPAVFWHLRMLTDGDVVEIERADGSVVRFAVTRITAYPREQAPLAALFGASSGSHLHLVTCDGEWQEHLQTYDSRLIVSTDIISHDTRSSAP